MLIYKRIANKFPGLRMSLLRANMTHTPEEYVKETVFFSLFFAIALVFVVFMFFTKFWMFLLYPVVVVIMFFYFFNRVFMKAKWIEKQVSREVVFAGRVLMIELESGIPLFNTFTNLSKNYRYVGVYFDNIIEKVRLGTSIDEAITETIEICPSENLRKMLWQILNSINTGADVGKALSNVIENVVREQAIAMKEFGNKLNPLAMFYMMIAVIIPSLGITMMIVFTTFLSISISLFVLILVAVLIGFVQVMFLFMIKNSRPNVDV